MQQLSGIGIWLLEDGCEHVPEPNLILAGALHVQDRRLQYPLEREGLIRLPASRTTRKLFKGAEKLVEGMPQRREIAAAGAQDLFTLGVVRQGVEQVFKGQMGVASCRRLPIGDVQDQLERGAEHGSLSLLFERRL